MTHGGPDAQNPDQDYSVEYAYFAPAIGQGRFKRVDGPGLPANGVQYAYVADSDLLNKLEFKDTMGAIRARAAYTHEANRDLVTAVENIVDPNGTSTTVSKYDYGQGSGYDALGRRTSVVNTGTAFGDAALSLWSYNDRSELTSAYRHEGDDPADPDDEITGQRRVYNYDHIGNRKDHTAGTAGPVYYCANDLNQYEHLPAAAGRRGRLPARNVKGLRERSLPHISLTAWRT